MAWEPHVRPHCQDSRDHHFWLPAAQPVVVGESLTDIITTSAGPVEFAGGSGPNVAYGLGRLSVNTGLLTVLGADRRAEAIRQHLDSAAVQLLRGATRLRRTSTATASLDSKGSAAYALASSGRCRR
ncbi:sugar/nucleoside kinase (ribokinase family) [Arthrobacter pascens]|uniref:PfkB family carbohydrate kinase n=1 Tax=Arthrobacter pascens TaxID=1677 RepID=UPI002792A5E4|nr:PfkB family carbohydrate kinase [Arthrobacter pascens]MDQ0679818.1 sugar/nucleoside kinase (ribokinase family) [Arthrobacter pascens]